MPAPKAMLAAAFTVAAIWGSPAARAETPVPSAVARWDAAAALADWGREAFDPIVMVAAARALIAAGAPLDEKAADPWNPAVVLADARRFAKRRRDIRALIDETAGMAGAREGAGLTLIEGRVAPGEIFRIERAYEGEQADALVRLTQRAADADVDLVVRGPGAAAAGEDAGPGTGTAASPAHVQWRPGDCARFELRVVNAGRDPVEFVLVSSPSRPYGCD